jgi:hypothetical protein
MVCAIKLLLLKLEPDKIYLVSGQERTCLQRPKIAKVSNVQLQRWS